MDSDCGIIQERVFIPSVKKSKSGNSVIEGRIRLRCDNPVCGRMFEAHKSSFRDQRYRFCKVCKKFHSYKVLVQQVIYKESVVTRVIRTAQDFRTPYVLADALEISPPTLYRWLKHYFKMSFSRFADIYIKHNYRAWVQPSNFDEYGIEYVQLKPFDFRSLGPGYARPDRGGVLPPKLAK